MRSPSRVPTLLAAATISWSPALLAADPPPPNVPPPAPQAAPPQEAPAPPAPAPMAPPPPAPPPYYPPNVPPVDPHVPRRQGFTLELGLGGALTFLMEEVDTVSRCFGSNCPPGSNSSSSSTETKTYGGLAPLSFGIGGFVSPQIALMFRATGSSFFQSGDQYTNSLYAGVIQFWPADIVYVSVGGGAAIFAKSSFFATDTSDNRTGFGFTARVGIAVANYTHHSLRFATEILPTFFQPDRAIGTTLVFEWQYF